MPAGAPINGVCAAAITPRRRGVEEIDLAALWELIDFLSAQKVSAILLMDVAGEFVHFPLHERVKMMTLAVRRSRIPIVVNVSHSALDCAVELAAAAMDANASAIVLMPPYFFRYGQAEVVAFYSTFLSDTRPDIPVYLYNVPPFTTSIEPDTAVRLLGSGFAGIVDASGDYSYFEAVRNSASAGAFVAGEDGLFARMRGAGARAGISTTACAIPELMLALDRAAALGRMETVHNLDELLQEFLRRSRSLPVPMALRQAVAARGLKTGESQTVLGGDEARALVEFRDWFRGWLPAVQKECARA